MADEYETETYTEANYTHLRYCINEGDDRVCHKDLRRALDELDKLTVENEHLRKAVDTLLAENARMQAALKHTHSLLSPPHHTLGEDLAYTVLDAALKVTP